jgi:hypothetical protein
LTFLASQELFREQETARKAANAAEKERKKAEKAANGGGRSRKKT